MTDRFQDYIKDVPMQIGRRFFPPPNINLPVVPLPRINDVKMNYSFSAEMRARTEYEEKDKTYSETKGGRQEYLKCPESARSSSSISSHAPSTAPSSSISGGFVSGVVLQPSKPEHGTITGLRSMPDKVVKKENPNPFDDFEIASNVFDDLELKTIDDRAVLSQVLSGVALNSSANSDSSASSTPLPQLPVSKTTSVCISSTNGIASYSVNSRSTPVSGDERTPVGIGPDHSAPLSGSSSISQSVLPPIPLRLTQPPVPPPSAKNSQLRVRLLTKGYRENIVNIALEKLPQDRLSLIEYYITSMRTMEKVGVEPSQTLSFLVSCQLGDKQKVLEYGATCAQLVQMGFSGTQSFTATKNACGDKVKALDLIIANAR